MIINIFLLANIFLNTNSIVNFEKMPDYFFENQMYKIDLVKPDKLSNKNKRVLYNWCTKRSKKKVTAGDINSIIDHVYKYSNTPLLLLAIIAAESNFDKSAENPSGASGLMQVMPLWVGEFSGKYGIKSKSDLKKVSNGILAGNYIIGHYFKREGSLSKGLSRYVNGSRKYVKSVLKMYIELLYIIETENHPAG
jgi:soluble lytic murein transglycosylase-like protein